MKTKAEIQAEIIELVKQLIDAPESIPAPEKEEWPKYKDLYWHINHRGRVESWGWNNDAVDNDLKDFGNIFKTKEAAIKELAYLKFERAVRAKAKELNDGWVADWKDMSQNKWEIIFGEYGVVIDCMCKSVFNIVRGSECKSSEAAQALLDHFGADKFLAYATGGEM